ncbi:MAG TPA: VOC family protein [Bryobacteraceae bacterium]|nr:VOC family protein [Bryobacteraceae bacterium]
MITGAHVLLFSEDPDADRLFFRDVLGFRAVDAGGGWLIFALPPTEAALHPLEEKNQEGGPLLSGPLYLMCDDLKSSIKSLEAKDVKCTPVKRERWGIVTTIRLPSGGEIGLYQPKHPTAHGINPD